MSVLWIKSNGGVLMSKILHSFTLHDHVSELLRKKSKKGYMSQNVSAAIEWYYTSPVWTKERDDDGEYTGKLVRANKGVVIAPYERKKYQEIIGTLNKQIDALEAEKKVIQNNRFKFWKKMPQ